MGIISSTNKKKILPQVDVDNGLDQDIFEINEELGLNLFEGDMKMDKSIDRSSLTDDKYRWPQTIPYYLEENLNINAKGMILKAFEQYRLKSCIDFKPWTGEANYISVFKGSGQDASSLSFLDRCSFELESICGMIQGPGNRAVWERVTQAATGPDQDNTNMGNCAGIGYFMYFSTSTGPVGKKALLESRIYSPKRGFQCLQFYSFNSGSVSDELNIWVRVYNEANPNGTLTKVREIKGAGLNYWQLHHVRLTVSDKFRVVFEGGKGAGSSAGGISIDDMNLSEMQCPTHVWHIRNFTHLLNTSPSGPDGRVYSPRYYSSDGYAFQIAVYVNGTCSRPRYLAVYFHLVSGKNDDNLQWPCPWRQGTMMLMDQHPDIRRRMSHQTSVTTDPNEGNQTFSFWDRPDKIGELVTESEGTTYYRGPGKGTNIFLSHERLIGREYIKGDDVYFLLTMEDVSNLVGPQPTPSTPPPSAKPTTNETASLATEPATDIPGLCIGFKCENDGVCIVDGEEPVCR
ncbi:hypothetical protein scyTo_0013528 [Scyliorhinus torazame]|uniref:Peptidase M12A domain-containing protein n=1 Tax=Scyliorhinus torazame TaxID=75743 RepID=A0A401NYM2_SCYTO|nr:hypothetical protein [Scyliorhinus torazame]